MSENGPVHWGVEGGALRVYQGGKLVHAFNREDAYTMAFAILAGQRVIAVEIDKKPHRTDIRHHHARLALALHKFAVTGE